MRTHSARWLVPALLAACAHVVDAPVPTTRTPLIEAVLVAGSDLSRFRLRWLDPADENEPPILPEEMGLELVHPDGRQATWEFDPDSAGQYLARLPIAPRGTYRLAGTLDGKPIAATTQVPGPVGIETPLGDTLFITGTPVQAGGALAGRITVKWRADGATVLALDSAAVLFAVGFTHGPEADLGVRQPTAGQRVGPTIRFIAMNRDADRYHFNLTGPETNLAGGFGVFGAAAETRRIVVWR